MTVWHFKPRALVVAGFFCACSTRPITPSFAGAVSDQVAYTEPVRAALVQAEIDRQDGLGRNGLCGFGGARRWWSGGVTGIAVTVHLPLG